MSFCDGFNAKLRDELCSRERSYRPQEVEVAHRRVAPTLQYGTSAFILGLPSATSCGGGLDDPGQIRRLPLQ
jgi:hypothetical protein